jgi:predicted phage terminase large subunit-like protein
MLHNNKVQVAKIESNNGGRGFARNIKRKLAEVNNQACVVVDVNQTSNKEARILSSSAWVASRVRMPRGWQTKYASFYTDLMSYLKKGKNKHDDAADVMAGIYEDVANTSDIDWGDSSTAL